MAFSRPTAFEYLRRAYEQNRLAHAYLVTGPPGSGKQALAAEVASLVNGTPVKEVFSAKAREIFIAGPESRSRRISIEQIRELEHALQMRAVNSRRKVVIISDADRLGDAAANAFLKTLEEPPSDSLLLLLSGLPEALPETILSRCIAIALAPDTQVRSKKEEKQGGGEGKTTNKRATERAGPERAGRKKRQGSGGGRVGCGRAGGVGV